MAPGAVEGAESVADMMAVTLKSDGNDFMLLRMSDPGPNDTLIHRCASSLACPRSVPLSFASFRVFQLRDHGRYMDACPDWRCFYYSAYLYLDPNSSGVIARLRLLGSKELLEEQQR